MATLAIELSASRLLGSVFGTSNLVWANVIGLMLLYLTIGYFLGGWIADRSPTKRTLYQLIVAASVLSGLIPLMSRPVLRLASSAVIGAQASLALGSFVVVVVLFSVPVILLGTISPIVIRLLITSVEHAGRIAGRVYAISTMGSILGTFLPVLLTIPLLGTTRTFLLFASLLFLVGFIGLLAERGLTPLLTVGIILFSMFSLREQSSIRQPLSDQFKIIYEGESAYNYIQVQEDVNGYRYLFLNEGQGIHSQWHPDRLTYQRTWSFFLAAPFFNSAPYPIDSVERLLVIGLAAGTIPRQYAAVYDGVIMDGIEIDPEIIHVGEQYFGISSSELPNLTTYAQDGRYVLNQLDAQYDVVAIDAYRPPYIPWHLTTVEFFREIKSHLTSNGVVAINVGRTPSDRRLVDALSATLAEVYPSVHAVDVPNTFNTILIATRQTTAPEMFTDNAALLADDPSVHPALHEVIQLISTNRVAVTPSDVVFTDDLAPIEFLVDSLVLNFLIGGELEQLQQ
jgi:spermidine synthase